MLKIVLAVCGVVTVLGYAAGSGLWVQTSQGWYQELTKPGWQPPPAVFGIVWSYAFTMLAIVAAAIALKAPTRVAVTWIVILAVTAALGVLWSFLFYGPHMFIASAIALTLCMLLTVALLVIATGVSLWLVVALMPYQLWLVVATSLSWGYVVLNQT